MSKGNKIDKKNNDKGKNLPSIDTISKIKSKIKKLFFKNNNPKFSINKNTKKTFNDINDFPPSQNNQRRTIYAAFIVVAALFALAVLIDQTKLRSGGYHTIPSAMVKEQSEVSTYEITQMPATKYAIDDNVSGSSVSILKYTDVSKMTNSEIADVFYRETVFIGDYLTADLEKFTSKSDDADFLHNISFLTADELTTVNAIKSGYNKSAQPIICNGKSMDLCEAVADIRPVRIFINLGSNELTGENTVDDTIYNYCQLVYNIKLASPSSKIYVISIPPVTKAREKDGFLNSDIQQYNEKMQEYANAWGASYVDLASVLKNGQGYLPDSYSTDGTHMTDAVYTSWAKFFKTYASQHINDGLKKQ